MANIDKKEQVIFKHIGFHCSYLDVLILSQEIIKLRKNLQFKFTESNSGNVNLAFRFRNASKSERSFSATDFTKVCEH